MPEPRRCPFCDETHQDRPAAGQYAIGAPGVFADGTRYCFRRRRGHSFDRAVAWREFIEGDDAEGLDRSVAEERFERWWCTGQFEEGGPIVLSLSENEHVVVLDAGRDASGDACNR